MNLKDILVHIDNRPTCESRLRTAIQLARRQESRITGIYIIPSHYYASHHVNLQELAEKAKQQFEDAV